MIGVIRPAAVKSNGVFRRIPWQAGLCYGRFVAAITPCRGIGRQRHEATIARATMSTGIAPQDLKTSLCLQISTSRPPGFMQIDNRLPNGSNCGLIPAELLTCSLPDADWLRQSQNSANPSFTRAVFQVGWPDLHKPGRFHRGGICGPFGRAQNRQSDPGLRFEDHSHSDTGNWLTAWRSTGSTLVYTSLVS